MNIKKALIGACLLCFLIAGAVFAAYPAAAAEVAVIDMQKVIDSSNPGKKGQAYLNDLQARLNADLKAFTDKNAKAKNAAQLTSQKQYELNAQYQREYSRVTAIVVRSLQQTIDKWISTNKKGVTIVIPAHNVLAYSPKIDVSAEILRIFNGVAIDVTQK